MNRFKSEMLKSALRQLLPPIIWNGIARAKGHSRFATEDLGIKIGDNTDIKGTISKRASRSIIIIGSDCLIQGYLVTETDDSQLIVKNNVFIGSETIIDCVASIIIDEDVLISYRCIISDSDNHNVSYSVRKRDLADWKQGKHDWSTTKSAPIRINRGVWIGASAIILKGVTIGEGAVVGAGSVVTKDIPPWTVVGGNPARLIRELSADER